jgi:hypothetical protein
MQSGKSKPTEKQRKTPAQAATRKSPSQICVSPSRKQQSKQQKGQEPNKNTHTK